jgi:hypothetical protein
MHADVGAAEEERGEELYATSLAPSVAHPYEVTGMNRFVVSPH